MVVRIGGPLSSLIALPERLHQLLDDRALDRVALNQKSHLPRDRRLLDPTACFLDGRENRARDSEAVEITLSQIRDQRSRPPGVMPAPSVLLLPLLLQLFVHRNP